MKRNIALLICLLICCEMCACGVSPGRSSSSVKFYYRLEEISYESGTNVVNSETFDAGSHRSDLEYLIQKYLAGPRTSKLSSPFPNGVKLSHITVQDNAVNIILSNDLATLTGYELTVACACMTLTILDITQAESVLISAESALLNNAEYITMDASCIYLLDGAVKK